MERWLPIPGYEGYYEVSDLGRVRSVDRTIPGRWGETRRRGRLTKLLLDKDGYHRVNLNKLGVAKQVGVHQLVLQAFVGKCPVGEQALHGDGVRTHNVLGNLSWGTPRANCADRRRHGRGPNGARNPRAKLCEELVRRIRADRRSQTVIAADFGVDQTTVSSIRLRKTWPEVA